MIFSLLILFLLFLISFIVSGSETAYFSLREKDILAFRRDRKFLFKLFNYPERFLIVILFMNNISNSFASAIFTSITLDIINKNPGFLVEILDTIIFSILLLLFAEITPKNIALFSPQRFAYFITPLFKIFYLTLEKLLYPVTFLFQMLRVFLAKGRKKVSFFTDFEFVIKLLKETEGRTSEDILLIEKVMELRKKKAKEIMIPFEKVKKVEHDKIVSEVLGNEIFYSHMPVLKKDEIVGVVKIWDLLKPQNRDKKIFEIISPCPCYTEDISIADLFLNMVKKREEFVILHKEGSYSGCIAISDIFSIFLKAIP